MKKAVVPWKPQQATARHIGGHHHELVALVGLGVPVRFGVAAAQIAKRCDAELLELLVDELPHVVALVCAAFAQQRDPLAYHGDARRGAVGHPRIIKPVHHIGQPVRVDVRRDEGRHDRPSRSAGHARKV